MTDTYVDGEKMARYGCKIAERKSCLLFKFPVFIYGGMPSWQKLGPILQNCKGCSNFDVVKKFQQ